MPPRSCCLQSRIIRRSWVRLDGVDEHIPRFATGWLYQQTFPFCYLHTGSVVSTTCMDGTVPGLPGCATCFTCVSIDLSSSMHLLTRVRDDMRRCVSTHIRTTYQVRGTSSLLLSTCRKYHAVLLLHRAGRDLWVSARTEVTVAPLIPRTPHR